MAEAYYETRHNGETVQICLPLVHSGWDISLVGRRGDTGQVIECAVRFDGETQMEFECPGLGNGFAPGIFTAQCLVTLIQYANSWVNDRQEVANA